MADPARAKADFRKLRRRPAMTLDEYIGFLDAFNRFMGHPVKPPHPMRGRFRL